MERFLKYAGIVAAVFVGLLILAVALVNLIPGEQYKKLISSGVKSAIGRQVVIEGDLDIKLATKLSFDASGIKLSNADWGSQPHMVTVDHIEGELALFPLLRGILDAALVIDKAELLLETNSSGQSNWEFKEVAKKAAEAERVHEKVPEAEKEAETRIGLPLRPMIRKLHLNGARITYVDGENGKQINIQQEKLHIGTTESELAIDIKGTYNNIPLAFSGGFDNPEFFVDNDPAKVKFDGNFGDVKLAIKGTAGPLIPAFDLDLSVNLNTDSVSAFSPLAGQNLPDIGPLSVSLKLSGKEGKYTVGDMLTRLKDETLLVEAKGAVADLATLDGLQLKATVNSGDLSALLTAVGIQPTYPVPKSIDAEVEVEGGLKALVVKQLTADIQGQVLNANVTAQAKNVMALEGVTANIRVEAESLDLIAELVKTELPPFGQVKLSAAIATKDDAPGHMSVKADLTTNIIKANVAGSIGDPLKLKDVDADINLSANSLTWVADYLKMDLPPLGALKASAGIFSQGDTLAVRDLKADLAGGIVKADVAGSVGDALKLKAVDAQVKFGIESLAALSKIAKTDLPPLGPLTASAGIASKGETFMLKDIKVNLADKNITAKVAGTVEDLLKVKGVNAKVDVDARSLAFLSDYVKMKLPPLGSLKASADIASKGETFEARNIKVDLAGEEIHVKVAGSMGDLLKVKAINADVDLGIENLAVLSDIAKTELPTLGPLNASASIASKGENFEVKQLKADLAGENIQANIVASVADVLKLTGINADINFAVDSLASLDPLLKKELPASGPVTLEGKLSSKGGLKSPTSIATVVKSDGFSANLKGSIKEPLAAKGIDLTLNVEAESMQKVGKLTGSQFQGKEPVKLHGRFTTTENTYELDGFDLKVGEFDIKGEAAFTQPSEAGGRPRVSGKLNVGNLDMSIRQRAKAEALTKAEGSPKSKKKKAEDKEKVKKDKVFPSEPLLFAPLRSVDADIELSVDSLTTLPFEFKELVARLTLDKGLLSLKPLKARVGDGTFGGTVALDARNKPAVLSADIEMTDATFRNFGGKIHFLMDIEGRGDSVAAIMARLNGQLKLDVREATLEKSLLTSFGSGLLNSLNPFAKDEESTEIICAVVLFDIKDGIADANRKIAAQMTDVTWFGGGEINLKTEEIDFGVSPKTRKVLDIGLGELAKLAHVGGTLAKPKFELDPKDVAIKYGKYAAAVATGGISLGVDLLWGKIKANTDVCAKILNGLNTDEASEKKKSK